MTLHEFQAAMIGVVLFAGAITCAAFLGWLFACLVINTRDRIFRYRVNKSLWADFLKFRESPEGMHKTLQKLDKTS
jgi:cytochrome P450